MPHSNRIYVLGHKNPDTDSICSAIALTYLKSRTEEGDFVAKRAGQINEETEYVLNYFGVEKPGYVSDLGTQVRDMEIRSLPGVSKELSVRDAWSLMREQRVVTLALTSASDELEGVITVGDITGSMMNQDPRALSAAGTPYGHIADTLEGEILVGSPDACFTEGKIFVGAANPDLLRKYIQPRDLVILGNRSEDHLCAVENQASCIVIGLNAEISPVILRYAEEMGTCIIRTPYDTFRIAQTINQSIPVRALMTSENLVTFQWLDFTDKIRVIMGQHRLRDFPILDGDRYIGTISRRNLLNIQKKKVILVDHNEVGQAVDNINEADILEIVDHHRIGNLETLGPILFRNQPVGCTATIVTQMFRERNVEIPQKIAGLLCAAILSDTLMFRSPTCTAIDRAAAEQLAAIAGIDITTFATNMFRAGSNLADKKPEEIFYQDFKKFAAGETNFGVGQISSMAAEELAEIRSRLEPYMQSVCGSHKLQMVFFMLTNILDETTELLCCGDDSDELIQKAFGTSPVNGRVILPNIISRKKQLIPALMRALQEI